MVKEYILNDGRTLVVEARFGRDFAHEPAEFLAYTIDNNTISFKDAEELLNDSDAVELSEIEDEFAQHFNK